jgi:hypothetical protein
MSLRPKPKAKTKAQITARRQAVKDALADDAIATPLEQELLAVLGGAIDDAETKDRANEHDPEIDSFDQGSAAGYLDGLRDAAQLIRTALRPVANVDRIDRAIEYVSSALEVIVHRGMPAGFTIDNLNDALKNLRALRGSQWHRLGPPEPPVCDVCGKLAKWRHPEGGQRCDACPRPNE